MVFEEMPRLGELLTRARARLAGPSCSRNAGGDLVHFKKCLPQARVLRRGVRRLAFRFWNRQPELPREQPDRILETDLFVKLQELEDVAARLAAETVKEAFLGINMEMTASSPHGTDRVP